jgi:hypothetical protein
MNEKDFHKDDFGSGGLTPDEAFNRKILRGGGNHSFGL